MFILYAQRISKFASKTQHVSGIVYKILQSDKVQSLPALFGEESSSLPLKKTTAGPISFSLNIQKTDDRKVPKTTR